ncbi:LysR family transcriptional regulator [Nocardia donostiensis]|uniref:LysR family transcriptional regulator n=1 Tax=Nocardia donostiensis TaxID=1538463 RepID=UPI0009DABDF6|nr:LysR family transcriptional regulator [Nocardia donostiensis]OQS14261.1 LysR family transcriptional regulator [Nocardia donostiensis]
MELQQMRYVVAVAETKNFTRAAQQCFVVQSALSHQIAALERELGVQLFARTSRRVQLTAAGEAFLPAARRCLEAAERAAAEAAAAAGQVRGQLRIGVIPTAAALDVPAALHRFREQHPMVRIAVRVGTSDELTAQVRAGDLDVAFLGLPESHRPRGVHAHELGRDRHVAVTAVDHPLAGRKRVSLRRLAEETFVDFPADSPGRAQSDQAFAAAALTRDVAFEIATADLIARIVAQGLAIALLPSAVASGLPGLATIAVTDGPGRIEWLVWSTFNPSPATKAFLDTVLTFQQAIPTGDT